MERAWLHLLSTFLSSAGRLLLGPPGEGERTSPPAEQDQLPQPLLTGEVLQPPDVLVTILFTHLDLSSSFRYQAVQNWTLYFRHSFMIVKRRGMITSLYLTPPSCC